MTAISSTSSRTDWERLDALRDEEIDLSDNPEVTPEMFAQAVVRRGLIAADAREENPGDSQPES